MSFLRKGWLFVLLVFILFIAAGCGSEMESPQSSVPNSGLTETPNAEAPTPSKPQSDKSVSDSDNDSTQFGPAPAKVSLGKVTAVRLINRLSGWTGGDGWIARTDDGGKTWKPQYQGEESVEQLFALNDQHAWVVFGEQSGQSNGRRLLQTTDGGKHWSPVGRTPNGGFLHFVALQEAFAANAHSTDGGRTWTTLAVPEHMVGDAYFHDKDHGWAVTKENNMIVFQRTVDGGKTWKSVMSRKTDAALNGALIRSAGTDDAWVECIGGSGMSQTSYSLFHTTDGGENWQIVLANSTAGGGPAPGFTDSDSKVSANQGSKPGPLYVVSSNVALMGGYCPACDNANSIGWTTDGGKTWNNGKEQYPGFSGALLAIADAEHGWWICTDNSEPSVMYSTSDGGKHWEKVHTFDRPKQQ